MLKKIFNSPNILSLLVVPLLSLGIYFILNSEKNITDEDIVPEIDNSRDEEGDTFSIVAYDPNTGQIGGAGTSCYGGHINFLNDIVRSPSGTLLGAIHTQAAYQSGNQNNARTRMLAGDTPAQIITWLQNNDCCAGNANARQYGIVGISATGTITTAGFTGSTNGNWAGHLTGVDPNTGMHYAIQGNILDTSTGGAGQQDILNDMETSFRNATGTLADKLMAALQGAKRVGGDNRCINSGNSGLASFVRVLRPSDPTGSPYINLSYYPNISGVEPIDVLQCNYDTSVSTPFCRTTINTFPYTMDFETKSWEQETATCSVNSSWIRSRFASPSGNTGPTGPNQGALYTFVEASDLGSQGTAPRSAILGSPCFQIPANHTAQLTFDYHMYGANMGTLSIQGSNNGGTSWTTLWSLSGDQGNVWQNNQIVDLSAYAGSTVKLRLNALLGNGFASDVAVDDIQISVTPIVGCPSATKTWNGSSWSPVGTPGATNPVIINGNYNTSTHGNLTACTLTINSGRTLTVNGNGFLNINGNITVNGNLIIEHQGSVVQVDPTATVTKTGTINVNVTTPNLASRDFMIMGSPMTGETRTGVWNTAFLVLDHLTGNFIPNAAVAAAFPLAENFADDNYDNWQQYALGIAPGEGYIVRPQAGYGQPGGIFNFTYQQGTLNNGNVNFPVLYNTPGPLPVDNKNASPNILANPYPSAIWANDFINANAMVDEVYFWEHNTPPSPTMPGAGAMNFSMEDISMYNLSGGTPAASGGTAPNGYIATGQGFAIKANAAGTATFTNTMRRTDNNNTLRNNEENLDRIWLEVVTPQYEMQSSTLIAFSENCTPDIDRGYDSRRMATVVSLYSLLEDGTGELGIQTREPFNRGMKIPLGFSTLIEEKVNYEISITNLEGININRAGILLLDTYENTTTNLKNGPYQFESGNGTFADRFFLVFQRASLRLSIDEVVLNDISMFPNPSKGEVTILSPNTTIESVTVFDIQGREVASKKETGNSLRLDISHLQSSVYFVKINTLHGSITKRIVKE